MRQKEYLAAVAIIAALACSCVLLNALVHRQSLLGASESVAGRWHASKFHRSALTDTLSNNGEDHDLSSSSGHRKKILGVVGVQTGFPRKGATDQYNYELRRQALRKTWFPATQAALEELESQTGLVVRFVIGHSVKRDQEQALDAESAQHGGFLRLPLKEAYTSLTEKTLIFLRTVTKHYDADYIVKVDDDVFLRIDRLPFAFRQWEGINADYIGCMKTGEIMKDPHYRWHEPQHEVLGGATYFTHAWGSLYIVSGRIASVLARVTPGTLRFFANEDVTIGSWMLAFNTTHMDDRRLCMDHCEPTTIGVYDFPRCAGLCDPVKSLPRLHGSPTCSDPAVHTESAELPRIPPIFKFQREKW